MSMNGNYTPDFEIVQSFPLFLRVKKSLKSKSYNMIKIYFKALGFVTL
jgi:hypothetical protein